MQLARHYRRGRLAPIRVVVIHTGETAETARTAEDLISYFASPSSAVASCHYAVDSDSVAQGVPEDDTAFAAPGCNADGVQIEHAGRAGQGAAGWADAYSQSMLRVSAQLVRGICQRHGIPFKHLTATELRAGYKGIVGHADVNAVYRESSHWDPGPDFPWSQYIGLIAGAGQHVPPPVANPRPVPTLGPINKLTLRPGRTGEDVRRFQQALWRAHGPSYRAAMRKVYDFETRGFTTFYGPLTERMCRDAYRSWGSTGSDQYLSWPGPDMLRRLGFQA